MSEESNLCIVLPVFGSRATDGWTSKQFAPKRSPCMYTRCLLLREMRNYLQSAQHLNTHTHTAPKIAVLFAWQQAM